MFVLLLASLVVAPVSWEYKIVENAPLSQEGEKPGGVIKLTRPDGTPIFVNAHAVAFVRGPLPDEHGHTTIVFASGAKQTVLESVDEIGKIMDAERGLTPEK